MIEAPAFLQVELLNGTRISGRHERYSDPMNADTRGAFVTEDADGTKSYVLWAAILRVTVFPLDASRREIPPPEKTEQAA